VRSPRCHEKTCRLPSIIALSSTAREPPDMTTLNASARHGVQWRVTLDDKDTAAGIRTITRYSELGGAGHHYHGRSGYHSISFVSATQQRHGLETARSSRCSTPRGRRAHRARVEKNFLTLGIRAGLGSRALSAMDILSCAGRPNGNAGGFFGLDSLDLCGLIDGGLRHRLD